MAQEQQPLDVESMAIIEKVVSMTLQRATALEKIYKYEIEDKEDTTWDKT